ncbi:MAG: hypothetical protein U9N53_00380, partial [Bacteroidota bacterium]|nr:hypothetical protein [Bacteroidota bacterium]
CCTFVAEYHCIMISLRHIIILFVFASSVLFFSACEKSKVAPIYSLVVNDAANSGHFDDTRNNEGIYSEDYDYIARLHFDGGVIKYSGVGIGAMWFHIGENSYYRWSSGTGNQVYKHIAIGRMIDIPVK